MYLTCTRHTVKEYALWRKAFDANVPMLEENGVLSTHIVQIGGNPTDIADINTWPSQKNWDAFLAAHNFKTDKDIIAMREKGGIVGEPTFFGGEVV